MQTPSSQFGKTSIFCSISLEQHLWEIKHSYALHMFGLVFMEGLSLLFYSMSLVDFTHTQTFPPDSLTVKFHILIQQIRKIAYKRAISEFTLYKLFFEVSTLKPQTLNGCYRGIKTVCPIQTLDGKVLILSPPRNDIEYTHRPIFQNNISSLSIIIYNDLSLWKTYCNLWWKKILN